MAKQTKSLDNQEIIDLLLKAEMNEAEIKTALQEIKEKTFESVKDYISNKQKMIEQQEEEQRKEKIMKAKKYSEQLQKEQEYEEVLKKRVLEKIAANRKENEDQTKPVVDDFKEKITAFIKVKISTPENESFILGFDENSTINDIYLKVQEKTENPKVFLAKYGYSAVLEKSDKKIYEVFKAKSIMLSIIQDY